MLVVGEAPCQCTSLGAIHTVSPGRISFTGPPFDCTRPKPETTCSDCPSGCVCQAVRAPGSKETRFETARAGAGDWMIGSCHTVPVKCSFGARRVGREPAGWISMESSGVIVFASLARILFSSCYDAAH